MDKKRQEIKDGVAKLQFPQVSGKMKDTIDAVKTLPALQARNYAFTFQPITLSPQWIEVAKGLNDTFQTTTKWANAHKVEIDGLLRSMQYVGAQVEGMLAQFQKYWAQSLAPMLEEISRAYQARLEIYPNLASRLEMLAKRGWFVSMFFGLSEFDQIATIAGKIDDNAVEEIIADAYRGSLKEHIASILHAYPEREFVLKPAMAAHLRGEYALSVPIFFAQADGISASMVGRQIFSGKKGRQDHISSLAADEISKLKNQNEDEGIELFRLMYLALWLPLSEHQPIGYSSGKREEEGYSGLNRHTVLHGESLDYATEINSLKAFSFLSYVASLLAGRVE